MTYSIMWLAQCSAVSTAPPRLCRPVASWPCIDVAIHAHSLTALERAANSTQNVWVLMTQELNLSTVPPLNLAACGPASLASAKPLRGQLGILQTTAGRQLTQAQLSAQDMAGRPAPHEIGSARTHATTCRHSHPPLKEGRACNRACAPVDPGIVGCAGHGGEVVLTLLGVDACACQLTVVGLDVVSRHGPLHCCQGICCHL